MMCLLVILCLKPFSLMTSKPGFIAGLLLIYGWKDSETIQVGAVCLVG